MNINIVSSLRFMLLWTLGTAAAVFGSAAITLLTLLGAGIMALFLYHGKPVPPGMRPIFITVIVLVAGFSSGFLVGQVQSRVLRLRFGGQLPEWLTATVVGTVFGVGGSVFVVLASVEQITRAIESLRVPYQEVAWFWLVLPVVIPVLTISMAQTAALWPRVRGAWLWMVAHIVSLLAVYTLLFSSLASGGVALMMILIFCLFGLAAPGIITGFTMLGLMHGSGRG